MVGLIRKEANEITTRLTCIAVNGKFHSKQAIASSQGFPPTLRMVLNLKFYKPDVMDRCKEFIKFEDLRYHDTDELIVSAMNEAEDKMRELIKPYCKSHNAEEDMILSDSEEIAERVAE